MFMKISFNRLAWKISRNVKPFTLEKIEEYMKTKGYTVMYMGTKSGEEELERFSIKGYARGKKAFTYTKNAKLVFVDVRLHTTDKISLLLHELAHIELGHIGNGRMVLQDSVRIDMEADALAYAVITRNQTAQGRLLAGAALLAAAAIAVLVLRFGYNRAAQPAFAAQEPNEISPDGRKAQGQTPYNVPQEDGTRKEIVYIIIDGYSYNHPYGEEGHGIFPEKSPQR